jgi:hypothetical protein
MRRTRVAMRSLAVVCFIVSSDAQAAGESLARSIVAMMMPAGTESSFADWHDLEAVEDIRWEALPPNMLDDGLPDGSYFTRRGLANLDGRPVGVVATGARTMVMNVYFRNVGAPQGDAIAFEALKHMGYTAELVRCPVKGAVAADRWWRISGPGKRPAVLQTQTSCNGKPCEGYALLLDGTLPSLLPQQRGQYTDRCAGAEAGAAMPPLPPWDQQLASLFAAWIPRRGAQSLDWQALDKTVGARWQPLPPRESAQPWKEGDSNHFMRSGEVDLGGRVLMASATGNRDGATNFYLEDQHTQATRGDVLKALQRNGYVVQLLRCGKMYARSSRNWYRVTGSDAQPAVLDYGLRCDSDACPKAQELYGLSLTGSLPPLQSGEIDAIGGRCPGR